MEDQFVIVTRAMTSTGTVITHVWGPYPTKSKAQAARSRIKRQDIDHDCDVSVHKILPNYGEML